jgi:hypothetical protein
VFAGEQLGSVRSNEKRFSRESGWGPGSYDHNNVGQGEKL